MGSGHSGLLRDQHPLLTTKPLLQPESDSALQACIPTPSSDTARQVGIAGGCEGHSLGKENTWKSVAQNEKASVSLLNPDLNALELN